MHEFLTGMAGTGKTYTLKERIEKSIINGGRRYGTLCATTGIAAVNLGPGVTTLASELKYFDTESLKDSYAEGRLLQMMKKVADKGTAIIIDECSMLANVQLDLICDAAKYVNELKEYEEKGGLKVLLCGDFCQLPPVKEQFCFENSKWWHRFAENTFKLTKIWRQDNIDYINALNAARCGDGAKASQILESIEDIIWIPSVDNSFEGTTLVSKNDEVDRFNQVRLDDLIRGGKIPVIFRSDRWGIARSEWKLIPEELTLTDECYVMILSNNPPDFTFANGDCGNIKEFTGTGKALVRLTRNDSLVEIKRITRRNMVKDHPDGRTKHPKIISRKEFVELEFHPFEGESEELAYKNHLRGLTNQNKNPLASDIYFDFLEKKWCIGEITYMPLRLAYATTVYKSQGLSLDRVQINYSNAFFGQPAMSYVALSRCRTPGGLRIVGNPGLVERRTNVAEEVLPFV